MLQNGPPVCKGKEGKTTKGRVGGQRAHSGMGMGPEASNCRRAPPSAILPRSRAHFPAGSGAGRTSRMSRIQRLGCFLAVLAAGLPAACASAGKTHEGEQAPLLVRLQDFRTGERFELAGESHTDRVTYYSGERHDAARKVQSDDIMTAFVEELDRQGYGAHARTGRAPALGSTDVIRWGLEVESGKAQTHWLVGTGSQAGDWQAFQKCRDTFLQLYNITVSYQAVE